MATPHDIPATALETDEEPVVLPKRRVEEDSEMDITPMIDITFLLLIFFLVASKLETETPVELPPAHTGTAVTMRNAIILTVANGGGESVLIYKGDGASEKTMVRSANPLDQEAEIAAYISEQLDQDKTKETILVKAERDIKHREVARVARAVGLVDAVHARGIQLHVAVLEVQ